MTVFELVHKYWDRDYIVDGIELPAGTPVPEDLKNKLVWMYSDNREALRLRAVTLPDKYQDK